MPGIHWMFNKHLLNYLSAQRQPPPQYSSIQDEETEAQGGYLTYHSYIVQVGSRQAGT